MPTSPPIAPRFAHQFAGAYNLFPPVKEDLLTRKEDPPQTIQAAGPSGPIENVWAGGNAPERGAAGTPQSLGHDARMGYLHRYGWRWAMAGWGLAVAALLTTVRAGSEPAAAQPSPSAERGEWKPLPLAVHDGRARVSLTTPHAGSRTLVIVSALARGSKTFPVRLSARAAERAESPELAPTSPRREKRIEFPKAKSLADPAVGLPPRERTFQLMVRAGDVASAANYQAIKAKLSAVGYRVQVYIDERDVPSVTPETLRDLVTTFDDQIVPVAARTFGIARDVDADGRFTVFMTSWLTRLEGGKHVVDAFVRGADLDLKCASPFSNHCDMMYLSTAVSAGSHLRTLLAHEYTHAATFSAKLQPDEEGWLDEGLAHLAEDLHGFSRSNLDYRVSAFLSRPERYRLIVEDYYAADLFRSHGNRGATYLFLRWCADRFGPGLMAALLRSPLRGVANLEAATGHPFAELYRDWSIALALSGLDSSRRFERSFQELNLRAPFDDWELAGPRMTQVVPGGPDDIWNACGTTSHYAIVAAAASGAVTIEVAGPPEAKLQVTAVPLPEDLASLDLDVRLRAVADGGLEIAAHVQERQGTPVRLSAIAWEPIVPGVDPHSTPFRRGRLDMLGIAARFGTSALEASGRLESKPFYVPACACEAGPLVFKVIGTDALGRRVAGWAEVEPAPVPPADAEELLVP